MDKFRDVFIYYNLITHISSNKLTEFRLFVPQVLWMFIFALVGRIKVSFMKTKIIKLIVRYCM